jgi:glutathione S-transferase
MAGSHQKLARKLSGGETLPVLELNGHAIGDSTRIIEALERRYPDNPLYPADPFTRRCALALEDFFDEELGPHTRLLAVHHMLPEPELMLGAFTPDLRGMRLRGARAIYPRIRARVAATFGIDDSSVALAYEKVRAAGRRFHAELQPSGFLVGDSFSIADLTLASLLAPLAAPEQYQYPQPQRDHPRLAGAREALAQLGLLDWSRNIYARFRAASAAIEDR